MADNGLGYITELSATDVLFGRGSGPNDHEGNIRFRQLVAERKAEYLATNHRQTKAKIAREIVNKILEAHGRFLKKVEHFEARRLGIPKGVDAWIIVDDDTVMEKAKQALRQNTNKQRALSPNRAGANSPQRGNSPVRGVSPVRGQTSPLPNQLSPMHGRRLPQQMPTFDDLEPLPFGSMAAAARAQQFAGMTPAQQQAAIQQQVQLQVQQQQQAQQQQQLAAAAQMSNLAALEPTALGAAGWGAGGADQRFNNQNLAAAAQLITSQGGDWGQGGSNHGGVVLPPQQQAALAGGWNGQQQQQQSMAPPQPRGVPSTITQPTQFSNNNNWSNTSEVSLPPPISSNDEDAKKRRQSLQMEDLMDSFSQLKAVGDFSAEAKLQESTDTMGTIEPIGAFGDSTSMSVTSFSSSTFSIFKDKMGESTDDMPFSRGVSRSSSINESRDGRGNDIDSSMQSLQSMGSLGNLSEVWGTRGMSLLDRLVQEERERANQEGGGAAAGNGGGGNGNGGGGGGGQLADNPRPVGLMEEEPDTMNSLGASSLSVMKAAYGGNANQKQDES